MSEMITVYNYRGAPLANLRANITRSWVLGGIGEATFDIAYTDDMCAQEYLEYGNFLLIEHSALPTWVGVIDTPREWKRNSVSVRAYDASKLWFWRKTAAGQKLTGSGGAIFTALVNLANAAGDTRIRPGSIYDDSMSREETLSDYVGRHISNVRTRTGNDYQMRATRDSKGQLIIYADWLKTVGSTVNKVIFNEGSNIESADTLMTEEGIIVNELTGYGDTTSAGTRLQSVRSDAASISQYGMRQGFQTFSGNKVQATLDANTAAVLAQSKRPQRILRLKAIAVGQTFDNINLGNIMKVSLFSAGFYGGHRGYNASVRILGMKYISNSNVIELVVSEV